MKILNVTRNPKSKPRKSVHGKVRSGKTLIIILGSICVASFWTILGAEFTYSTSRVHFPRVQSRDVGISGVGTKYSSTPDLSPCKWPILLNQTNTFSMWGRTMIGSYCLLCTLNDTLLGRRWVIHARPQCHYLRFEQQYWPNSSITWWRHTDGLHTDPSSVVVSEGVRVAGLSSAYLVFLKHQCRDLYVPRKIHTWAWIVLWFLTALICAAALTECFVTKAPALRPQQQDVEEGSTQDVVEHNSGISI